MALLSGAAAFYFVRDVPLKTGCYQFGFPQGHTKLAMISVEDIGGIVASIFNEPEAFTGHTVGAVGAD